MVLNVYLKFEIFMWSSVLSTTCRITYIMVDEVGRHSKCATNLISPINVMVMIDVDLDL